MATSPYTFVQADFAEFRVCHLLFLVFWAMTAMKSFGGEVFPQAVAMFDMNGLKDPVCQIPDELCSSYTSLHAIWPEPR